MVKLPLFKHVSRPENSMVMAQDSSRLSRAPSREERSMRQLSTDRPESSPREPVRVPRDVTTLRAVLDSRRQIAGELRERVLLASRSISEDYQAEFQESAYVELFSIIFL